MILDIIYFGATLPIFDGDGVVAVTVAAAVAVVVVPFHSGLRVLLFISQKGIHISYACVLYVTCRCQLLITRRGFLP